MYHVVLVLLVVVLLALIWQLVHSAPSVLALLLPRFLTWTLGITLLVMGVFLAFAAAVVLHSGNSMLRSLLFGYVGIWWILATSASMRGSEDDKQMLRRVFLMLGLLAATLIVMLSVGDPRGIATLELLLVTSGFWVTANYLRFLDRGR